MNNLNNHLQEHDWVKVERVFSEQGIKEVKLRIQRHIDGMSVDSSNPMLAGTVPENKSMLRKFAEPFFIGPLSRWLVFDLRIFDFIAPVIGTGPDLLFVQVFMRPAFHGSEEHCH